MGFSVVTTEASPRGHCPPSEIGAGVRRAGSAEMVGEMGGEEASGGEESPTSAGVPRGRADLRARAGAGTDGAALAALRGAPRALGDR